MVDINHILCLAAFRFRYVKCTKQRKNYLGDRKQHAIIQNKSYNYKIVFNLDILNIKNVTQQKAVYAVNLSKRQKKSCALSTTYFSGIFGLRNKFTAVLPLTPALTVQNSLEACFLKQLHRLLETLAAFSLQKLCAS